MKMLRLVYVFLVRQAIIGASDRSLSLCNPGKIAVTGGDGLKRKAENKRQLVWQVQSTETIGSDATRSCVYSGQITNCGCNLIAPA